MDKFVQRLPRPVQHGEAPVLVRPSKRKRSMDSDVVPPSEAGDSDGELPWEEGDLNEVDEIEVDETVHPQADSPLYRSSFYVDAFQRALDTVLEHEAHLFSDGEKAVFAAWRGLDYEAQYLYVRLFLRKEAAWHRVQGLQYQSNIAGLDAAVASLCRAQPLADHDDDDVPEPFVFLEASHDHITTLADALPLVSRNALAALARDYQLRGTTKAALQAALLAASTTQATLAFGRRATPQDHAEGLFRRVRAAAGPCVRVAAAGQALFGRVHLVFCRTAEWTERSLTTALLASMSKRAFVPYVVSRTAVVFASRPQLLAYEQALQDEHAVDLLVATRGPTADVWEAVVARFLAVADTWRQGLLDDADRGSAAAHDNVYLRRFCAAHIWTRLAHKAAHALGRLHRYAEEHALLTELLGQRRYGTARRGAWYQRKALVEELYMDNDSRDHHDNVRRWRQTARATCALALQDPACHLVYHHGLRTRLARLERRLRIPRRLQHDFGHLPLRAAEAHVVEGVQVRLAGPVPPWMSTKTVWVDERVAVAPDAAPATCSVEAMCLHDYARRGWSGVHTEGGLVRTLFAYLFLDILFLDVPHVLQTPFQTHPLDLYTDAFYASRAAEIHARLATIANGGAEALVRRVHAAQAPRQPWVVGLQWLFPVDDVAAVARCLGGHVLAAICQVLAQEYRQRTGGLPDLLLWRLEPAPAALFVEVKSKNDRLSDTQRLWVHVLREAGARVALCRAVDRATMPCITSKCAT